MPESTIRQQRPRLLTPWRRGLQWAATLAVFLLPWIQPGGNSLLRIDIPSLSLHLFGQVLRIEELYLFLLFVLACAFAVLLATLILGRVWCGWGCPQTTLSDLAEWIAGKFRLAINANRLCGSRWRIAAVQLIYLLLTALVAANLLWYFIEPQRFFAALIRTDMDAGVVLTFMVMTALVYLDIALVRRLMCREFCPYGRIQTTLVDPGTLTLQLPDSERARCIRCASCVRACPMEIDIRNGYQIECINCGRCLDACRRIMRRRGEPGLIYYRFGSGHNDAGALLNPRVVILALLFLLSSGGLLFATFNRAEVTLKISVSPAVAGRILDDGRRMTFFNAWINNRGTSEQVYRLAAFQQSGAPLEVRGQTETIVVAAGANHKLDWVLISPAREQPYMIEFQLLDRDRQVSATAAARITPLPLN